LQEFESPDTTVWAYDNNGNPVRQVGVIKGTPQASAFFNKAENQMVVVGGIGGGAGAQRGIWTAPVDPAKPDDWVNNLTP
jgi:hypothetical protein